MKTYCSIAAACALSFAVPQTAFADDGWPTKAGDFVDVAMISVDDGHDLDYAKHLATIWRKAQDFAKQKGWITDYQVWHNEYRRKGEPDVYLVTWFPKMADATEQEKRDKAFLAYMQQTDEQLEVASGERAEYRHLSGSMLMRVQDWKN
jgi:hypothetical protein